MPDSEDSKDTALRSFCARILGWSPNRADVVEQAIRSIALAADHSASLVVLGEFDLVPIAYALHRRMVGTEQPFIVADRRRGNTSASVRSPANYVNGVAHSRQRQADPCAYATVDYHPISHRWSRWCGT